ncbi:MAG: hypothetical protein HFJ59_01005 [Clostridia bacterium]|nr:hypothetical protein [Clostridia bacterium]
MNNTKRFNLSEFKKVLEEDDIHGNFTSVRGAYLIPNINQVGFYKKDNCTVTNSDLRELLAMKVLEIIGMPHADIVPIYDEENKNNGCFSLNILKESEMFISLPSETGQVNTVKKIIENDIKGISKLCNIDSETIKGRKEYIAQYLFASALLANTDIKEDNREIIYNKKTGKYRNAEYYDAGNSFMPSQDSFYGMNGKNSEKILSELYKDYAVEIFPLAQQTEQKLTKSKITELTSDSIYDGFDKEVKKDIVNELNNRVNLITRYNHNIIDYGMAEPPMISIDDIKEGTKDIEISLKDRVKGFILKIKDKIITKGSKDDKSYR